jgi:hypothetical protein
MTTDRSQRMLFLQARNSQMRFFRELREKGLAEPEKRFAFLELESADELTIRIVQLKTGKPAIESPTRADALSLAKEWVRGQSGTVLCFVPNVGVLVGDPMDYLCYFPCFESLIERDLFFSTPSLDSGFECGEFEKSYHPVVW